MANTGIKGFVQDFADEAKSELVGRKEKTKTLTPSEQLSIAQAGRESWQQMFGPVLSPEERQKKEQEDQAKSQQAIASIQARIANGVGAEQQKRDQIEKEYKDRAVVNQTQPIAQQLQKSKEKAKPNMAQDITMENAGGKKTRE